MSYKNIYDKFVKEDLFSKDKVTEEKVIKVLGSTERSVEDLKVLLSHTAGKYLEPMALKAHELTVKHFGKTIQLYTPLYLSNWCDNNCSYCGFKSDNQIARRTLTLDELETEAKWIASTGLKHILLLTGESRERSSVEYIKDCVKILKPYFSSISIEVYALTEKEYGSLISEGVDGLTIYQEVYNEDIYSKVHTEGPKNDYLFRIDAPERAARQGIRYINIGSLLGLGNWREEAFFTGLHAKYLQDKFPATEIGVSVPRLRPHKGTVGRYNTVGDKEVAQMITALRIFIPRVHIVLSTREDPAFRENILPLGVTRMSAGSTTSVGGHTTAEGICADEQFTISDERNVTDIKKMLKMHGYQPVLKDWMRV